MSIAHSVLADVVAAREVYEERMRFIRQEARLALPSIAQVLREAERVAELAEIQRKRDEWYCECVEFAWVRGYSDT